VGQSRDFKFGTQVDRS